MHVIKWRSHQFSLKRLTNCPLEGSSSAVRCDDLQCSNECLRERRSMATCIGLAGWTAGPNLMPGWILVGWRWRWMELMEQLVGYLDLLSAWNFCVKPVAWKKLIRRKPVALSQGFPKSAITASATFARYDDFWLVNPQSFSWFQVVSGTSCWWTKPCACWDNSSNLKFRVNFDVFFQFQLADFFWVCPLRVGPMCERDFYRNR